MSKIIRLGIVGACGRGASFKRACDAIGNIEVTAVCDINTEDLATAAERLGAEQSYTDYETMLDKAELDAVIVGTPMPLHVSQSVAALERQIHVLSEVPAAVSLAEAQTLVAACKNSQAIYMMAENYTYLRNNMIVREMVRRGVFGTPYYGEGEYIHELKGLNEVTKWRRKWQTGIPGNTYITHSLGPLLQWMPNDRVARLCCAGSGHHFVDPRGDRYENDDSTVVLCQMASGGLLKIRLDMLSDRPHAMTNYQLQGTDGCYESSRAAGEPSRIWLRAHSDDASSWSNIEALAEEYLPQRWRDHGEAAAKAGHGGGDYIEILDFVDAIAGKIAPPIGIHEAMDMTLPGLISQQSIVEDCRWLDVPDSREW